MSEEKYIEGPIRIELDIPYYMPLNMYYEFMKRVKQGKKFVVVKTENIRKRGEGTVLDIKLVME